MSASPAYKSSADVVPYTFQMSMCEGQLVNTICVMYRTGFHKELWATCSNIAAGMGLTHPQAIVVFNNAHERAKRLVKA